MKTDKRQRPIGRLVVLHLNLNMNSKQQTKLCTQAVVSAMPHYMYCPEDNDTKVMYPS
jgi:hypothetical protein